MFYDRKIKYLDYVENGERIKGCGFVKVEYRDGCINLEIMVTGVSCKFSGLYEVLIYAESGQHSPGQICIQNGRGNFCLCNRDVEAISRKCGSYSEWQGVSIILEPGKEISGLWGNRQTRCVLERVEPEMEMGMSAAIEHVEKQQTVICEKLPLKKSAPSSVEAPQKEQKEDNPRSYTRLLDDKWQQLSAIYPHIKPFKDKREYLSIRPTDFVLLSSESYKTANNSFLLHGFYNYQHLILVREEKRGETFYYVGTPGIFYEREKQVAIMFGFRSFECAKEPAQEGDFGYYLMRVQL